MDTAVYAIVFCYCVETAVLLEDWFSTNVETWREKSIEFVYMEKLFQKVPIHTFHVNSFYAKEFVTLKSHPSNWILLSQNEDHISSSKQWH